MVELFSPWALSYSHHQGQISNIDKLDLKCYGEQKAGPGLLLSHPLGPTVTKASSPVMFRWGTGFYFLSAATVTGLGPSQSSPWTSTWSQVIAQTRDICMAFGSNRGHRHQQIPVLLPGQGPSHGYHQHSPGVNIGCGNRTYDGAERWRIAWSIPVIRLWRPASGCRSEFIVQHINVYSVWANPKTPKSSTALILPHHYHTPMKAPPDEVNSGGGGQLSPVRASMKRVGKGKQSPP